MSAMLQVFMLDQEAGTAQLKARHPLNCEDKRRHVVSIAAVSCTGATSDRWDYNFNTGHKSWDRCSFVSQLAKF